MTKTLYLYEVTWWAINDSGKHELQKFIITAGCPIALRENLEAAYPNATDLRIVNIGFANR